MAVHVVEPAFFRVPQDLVGLGGFLELVFRFLVARIAVGVIFEGYLAVLFFDVVRGGVAGHPQNLVVIFFSGGHKVSGQAGFHRRGLVAQGDFFVPAIVDADVGDDPLHSLSKR